MDLRIRQQPADHHQIHVVVIHHQDVGVRRLEALPVLLPLTNPGTGGQGEGPQLLFIHNILLQGDDEGRALGIDAVYADLTAHQLHQLLDDAQPQAGALDETVFVLLHPPEGIEDIGNVLLPHALPGVLYGVPDAYPVDGPAFAANGQGDGALAGILHGVIQQVDENLLDPHLVSAEHAGNGRVHVQLELQALFLGLDPDHIDDLGEKRAGFIGDVDDLHLSGLDLGYVQRVVDQRQQQLAGALDIPRVLRNVLRNILPQDELVQPDDGIDGRADLVAHAGEEVVLRPVQLLDLLLLPLGEGVFLLIHPIQEHEQHAGEQSHHNHGKGGIQQRVLVEVRHGELREIEGGAVAEHRLRHTQSEKYDSAPALQGDADVNKAEHKPLRHAAVKSARREKRNGKQRQQQHCNGGCAGMDALFLNADPNDQRHGGQADHHHDDIPDAPAHGQGERYRNHADACHNAEHALMQADSVIADDLKPFFYHDVPTP